MSDPWTVILFLKSDPTAMSTASAQLTYRLTQFFVDRQFVVFFHRPNVLVISGARTALVSALGRLDREPRTAGKQHSEDSILCQGAWTSA